MCVLGCMWAGMYSIKYMHCVDRNLLWINRALLLGFVFKTRFNAMA
jgi:hypothetical protein